MTYELTVALRLLVSALLGGLIGLERESLNKTAGFRTHTLVCLGSCLIMITSLEIPDLGGTGDPGRLAAQVVSGIGFLGAGTIMRSGMGIKGLTTAASLWVVAGIGLAVGAGNYLTATITTAIVFLVLVYFGRVEGLIKKRQQQNRKIELVIADRPGQLGLVSSALGEMDIHIRNVKMGEPEENKRIALEFEVKIPYTLPDKELLEKVKNVSGVYKVSLD